MVCGFDEFLLLMSKNLNDEQMDEEMMEVFKTFDSGNKEYIDVKDLKRVLKGYQENLTDEEFEILFKGTDEDGDGKINLDKELLGSAFNAFGSAINLGSVRNEFKADINELDPDQLDVIMENFISRT